MYVCRYPCAGIASFPWGNIPLGSLRLFKTKSLPSSRFFSIFGAVFNIKDGAKIQYFVLITKYFDNYFSIFCIMSTKNEVSGRFIAAFEHLLKVNAIADKKDFALKLGISPSMVTEISKGRSAVGTTAIQNIVMLFNISGDWLLTGEGQMLRSSTPKADGATSSPSEATPKTKKSEKISSTEDTTAFLAYMREQATAHTKAIKEKDAIIMQQNQQITDLKCQVTRLEGENRHLIDELDRIKMEHPQQPSTPRSHTA